MRRIPGWGGGLRGGWGWRWEWGWQPRIQLDSNPFGLRPRRKKIDLITETPPQNSMIESAESIICLKPPICLQKQSQLQVGEPSFRKICEIWNWLSKGSIQYNWNLPTQQNGLVQAQSWIGIDALRTTNIFEVHAIQPQKFQGRVVCRQCRLQGRVACYDFSRDLLTRKPCGLNQQSSFWSVPLTLICSSVEPTTKTTSQKKQNQRFGN